jgi:steroid 5-alpha reductase family enzyme
MIGKQSAALGASVAAALVGAAIAWAGSQGGATLGGVPVFALGVGLAFLVQWVVFIPSYVMRTERYYDLTGSLTYISVMVFAVASSGYADARSMLLLMLVLIWAGRLGTFLFLRVLRSGRDSRFDELKHSFARFLMTWTLQGLWVSLTLAAALAAVTSERRAGLDAFALVGLAVWAAGFSIEAAADYQKSRFRALPANKGAFISSGLWSRSRHPNYFGEIVLWTGVAIIALPVLSGWQLATLVSPVFVYLLLTRVSGIPLLERKANEKWGGQAAYEAYKRRTSVLVPWMGRKGG